MQTHFHPLLSPALGTQRTLTSFHFGAAGVGEKAYIQASLHADELPGMLAAHHLRGLLEAAETRGEILGEVVLVPLANPIGLNQTAMHHYQLGRFELASLENFNRNYPDFFELLKDKLEPLLGADANANKQAVRLAMREALLTDQPATELQCMRQSLMLLSHDADVVLDLHCDYEAALHMYVEQPMVDQMTPLAAYLGAKALLWAHGSGGSISFDEALSGPWWRLAKHFGDQFPIPMACASSTVELRGQADVSSELAEQDAQAIFSYLQYRGIVAGNAPPLPQARCEPTPLAGTEALHAPHPGVIAFAAWPGEAVVAGQVLAHVIDPISNRSTPVTASTDGVLYARHNLRWATANMELCRVAGKTPMRSGNLLSP